MRPQSRIHNIARATHRICLSFIGYLSVASEVIYESRRWSNVAVATWRHRLHCCIRLFCRCLRLSKIKFFNQGCKSSLGTLFVLWHDQFTHWVMYDWKRPGVHNMWYICTVHTNASNESSIVGIGKSTKLQCNVAKNFGNITTNSFTHGDLVQKWGKSSRNSEKSWFYILHWMVRNKNIS